MDHLPTTALNILYIQNHVFCFSTLFFRYASQDKILHVWPLHVGEGLYLLNIWKIFYFYLMSLELVFYVDFGSERFIIGKSVVSLSLTTSKVILMAPNHLPNVTD